MSAPIDLALARRLLKVVDQGLVRGQGEPIPGKMCVEAAVCYTLGLPHGDNPECVDPVVRAFKIALNDSKWSSDIARAKGMRAIAVAQLGSRRAINSIEFSKYVALETVRRILPVVLRKAGLQKEVLACEQAVDLRAAYAAAANAAYAAANAAATVTYAVAYAAANVANAAANVANAAANVANAAANANAVNAAANAAANAAYAAANAAYAVANTAYAVNAADAILRLSADICLEALRACKSPGIVLWDQLQREV